ncbi:hypothetical protein FHS85_003104 [Rhodoligotrophos appendicifer]|uniref:hypothetical protein n=1 Tax=Rhodoligotrophos appendicifer TaxID=987056 RepID=UPI001185846B|nr:hypothetical protein [Rhodoligotrophos appendicifer]
MSHLRLVLSEEDTAERRSATLFAKATHLDRVGASSRDQIEAHACLTLAALAGHADARRYARELARRMRQDDVVRSHRQAMADAAGRSPADHGQCESQ